VGGAIGALANAVDDALAPLGATIRTLPLSPPNVLAAIDAARRNGSAAGAAAQ
jgi:carbon-monoxide dehydrogenase large subunit